MALKQANRKESKSHRVVGGRSLWGNLLDVACAKYGWTLHYVLWEISYINLYMMLTDSITTVDIKDTNEKIISGDDPSNIEAFISQNKD